MNIMVPLRGGVSGKAHTPVKPEILCEYACAADSSSDKTSAGFRIYAPFVCVTPEWNSSFVGHNTAHFDVPFSVVVPDAGSLRS